MWKYFALRIPAHDFAEFITDLGFVPDFEYSNNVSMCTIVLVMG